MSDIQVAVALSLLSITFLLMFLVTYINPPTSIEDEITQSNRSKEDRSNKEK